MLWRNLHPALSVAHRVFHEMTDQQNWVLSPLAMFLAAKYHRVGHAMHPAPKRVFSACYPLLLRLARSALTEYQFFPNRWTYLQPHR